MLLVRPPVARCGRSGLDTQPCALHSQALQLSYSASRSPRRLRCPGLRAEDSDGFLSKLQRFGRSIQGGLPVVGLVSRLVSPEGGFDDKSYPEFCRSVTEAGCKPLTEAVVNLQTKYKQRGARRTMLLIVWMIQRGCGVLPGEYFVLAGRRLHASNDIEDEMLRFEGNLESEMEKYTILEPPVAPVDTQAAVAIDAIASAVCGLRDSDQIPQDDQQLFKTIVSVLFQEADEDMVAEHIANKVQRVYA